MKQKRRAPTLVFKAIEESASGGVQLVREAHPSIAPQEAQEWALDDELNAFRDALPSALRSGVDSVECIQRGPKDAIASAPSYRKASSEQWRTVGQSEAAMAAAIPAEIMAQVAAIQSQPRRRADWRAPEATAPRHVSQETLAAMAPRRGPQSQERVDAYDSFALEQGVSALIEARGARPAHRLEEPGASAPHNGRSATSSFPDLNAFESYEPLDAPDDLATIVEEPALVIGQALEADAAGPSEKRVPQEPPRRASSPMPANEEIQTLPSHAKRRVRGIASHRQQASSAPSGTSRRLWLWLSGAAAMASVAVGAWLFFG